jgi:hypothetical protein
VKVRSRINYVIRAALIAAAFLGVASFWSCERLANGIPDRHVFPGAVALLVPDDSNIAIRQMGLALSTNGQRADGRRLLRIDVTVCGNGGTAKAALLLTGASLLADPVTPIPPDATGLPRFGRVHARLADGDLVGAGMEVPLGRVQVIQFSLPVEVPCAPPSQGLATPSIPSGTAYRVDGTTSAPMTRLVTEAGFSGSRRWVALPGTGQIPGVDSSLLGTFYRVPGLVGAWQRPRLVTYESSVEFNDRAVVELAQPSDRTLVGASRWDSSSPEAVGAQLVDGHRQDHLESLLALFTVLLGVAVSLLATAIWDATRRRAYLQEGTLLEAPRTQKKSVVAWLVVALAVGVEQLRVRRRH